MNADQRKSRRIGDRLRLRNPHQKCSHQAGTVGHADRIQILQRDACLIQRRLHHLIDLFNMLPGRDFRHYAPVQRMKGDL